MNWRHKNLQFCTWQRVILYKQQKQSPNSYDMSKSLKFVLFALSFVGSGPSDALRATHPFSPVPMFVCHGCQVSAVPCLPCAALCVLCVMVLGVPAAIIPEHSQAEPGGGSHLLLLFLMDNLEGESKRERGLEEKNGDRLPLPVSFTLSHWQQVAKGSCVCFTCESSSWSRVKMGTFCHI